jgi:hypothetical protein
MSIKSKVLAAAASLTLVGGLGAGALATAGAANAATPSCGHFCIEIFSHQFGTFARPNFVLDVYKQAQRVGQPIILFRTSNNDLAEDFTIADQGSVGDFFAAGLVSSALNLHYSANEAYEIEYAPLGAETGLCMGVGSTAVSGTKVDLRPCGVSSKTVWVVDLQDSPFTTDVPLINGSDTNFSHPFVLTYPSSSYPTDIPRAQLFTANLTGESHGGGPIVGTVDSNQLWAFDQGVLP